VELRRGLVRTYPKDAESRPELAQLLRFFRRRIDGAARTLGPYRRLRSRIGKRVTQQELAEAIGVSREWYSLLESAASGRASTGLLDRLADALMVTPQERARLFQAAIPELGRAQGREDPIGALEGLSRLRSLTKRLWAATSIEDVLTRAGEHVAASFESAVLVRTSCRRGPGVWERFTVGDKREGNEASRVIREVDGLFSTPEEIDGLNLYPQLLHAGDTGTGDLQPFPVRRTVATFYARRRLPGFSFIKARLRSRGGLIGAFCIWHELGQTASASERAVLGAFAELVSLALSSSGTRASFLRVGEPALAVEEAGRGGC
jgi:transcriptional regulator with XRE-family HTH domain